MRPDYRRHQILPNHPYCLTASETVSEILAYYSLDALQDASCYVYSVLLSPFSIQRFDFNLSSVKYSCM